MLDNPDLIAPRYMRARNQWCIYKLLPNKDANKKPIKTPFQALMPDRTASSTDPQTWTDLYTAVDVCNHVQAAGVSYMLTKEDGLVFIDLDNCVSNGLIDEWALAWVKKFASYTEFSQSGTGLHIIIFAKMEGRGRKNNSKGVEVYYEKRQVCMNPNVFLQYNDINHCQKQLDEFMREFFPLKESLPQSIVATDLPHLNGAQVNGTELEAAINRFCSKEERRQIWFQHNVDEHERDESQSGVDWSIAIGAARMNLPATIIADMIARNREMFGQTEKLHKHKDYLNITVSNALNYVADQKTKAEQKAADDSNVVNIQFGKSPQSPAEITSTKEHDALGPDFKFYSCDEVMNCDRDRDWLVPAYIPTDALVWMFGKPSAGKSFLVLSMALAIATGGTWGNMQCTQGGVAYICGEGLRGIGKRLKGAMKEMNITDGAPQMIVSNEPVIFNRVKQVYALIDRLRAYYTNNGIPLSLIVIDTKSTCMEGNENDAETMNTFTRSLRLLQHAFGCTVMPIDHVSKADQQSARGSTVQIGAADVAYLIKRVEDDYGLSAGVSFRTEMQCHKPPKDFEEPEALTCEAHVINIGTDDKTRTTLFMQPVAPRVTFKPRTERHALTKSQEACLNELERLFQAKRAENERNGDIHKPAHVTVKEWRKQCRTVNLSPSAVRDGTLFLFEHQFAIKIAPQGNSNAELAEWFCAPNN